MLELVHNPRSGKIEQIEVPAPVCGVDSVLVQTLFSVFGPGDQAAGRTGRVSAWRAVLSMRRAGAGATAPGGLRGLAGSYATARDALDQPRALGGSSAGKVLDAGPSPAGLKAGDLVSCFGPGVAIHAETVVIPQPFAVLVPDGVSAETAAFGAFGAAALEAVRAAGAELGEEAAVIGLGLLGQLCVQLFAAAGCRVIAIDPDPRKVETACRFGARPAAEGNGQRRESAAAVLAEWPGGDALEKADGLLRDGGRLAALGPLRSGNSLERFIDRGRQVVSIDWRRLGTDPADVAAFLDLAARGRVEVEPLIDRRLPFSEAGTDPRRADGPVQTVLFEYAKQAPAVKRRIDIVGPAKRRPATSDSIGWIGAGAYSRRVLIPAAIKQGFRPRILADERAPEARRTAEKFGFETVCSAAEEVLADPGIETVFIAARHSRHADLAAAALQADKHVFLTKPLAIDRRQLEAVRSAIEGSERILTLGFNRRFSAFAAAARDTLRERDCPLSFHYRIQAGRAPRGHWLRDRAEGGRTVGELCQFVDLMGFLIEAPLSAVSGRRGAFAPEEGVEDIELRLDFADGSGGTITYLTSSAAPLAAERLDIWAGDIVVEMEDFERAWFWLRGREREMRRRIPSKGSREAVAAFRRAVISGGPPPIPYEDLLRTSEAMIEVAARPASGEVWRPG